VTGKQKLAELSFPFWIALGSTAVTFLFGECFAFTLNQKFYAGFHEVWSRWDTVRYLALAENGYSATADAPYLICFFPLYPILIRLGMIVFQDPLVSALVVSNTAFLVGLIALFKLVELDFGRRAAEIAVVLCAFFPTAYFFHVAYTESVFFSLSVATFYLARRQHWWAAGIMALLCSTSRLPGLLLGPALLLEYLHQIRFQWRAVRWSALAAFLPIFALGLYLWMNWNFVGNPLAFLSLQKSSFSREFTWPWAGFLYDCRALFTAEASTRFLMNVEQLASFLFSLVALAWCAWKLRPSCTLFFAGLWMLSFCYGFWMSVPRFLLVAFPIYLFLAWLTERRPALYHNILFASILLYALGMTQFAMGRWAH